MTLQFLEHLPRFIFFTGKGGVGKTSIACASAVKLARGGKTVLLVSTDPASNVGQVFGQSIGNSITPIEGLDGLSALEIDPLDAAEEYRERILAPIKDFLSAEDLATATEQLSGSCTTEVASFNEFTALLTDPDLSTKFDHIIFDTAPTGHTVRLLKLPGEWTAFLEDGLGDASCLGPLSGLEKTKSVYADALRTLGDPSHTRLVLVARPQTSSLAEAADTVAELGEANVRATNLVINGILPKESTKDPLADAIRTEEAAAIQQMPPLLKKLTIDQIPLRSFDMVGMAALEDLFSEDVPPPRQDKPQSPISLDAPLADLVEKLGNRDKGLIVLMGKGGVGKTTIASAIAVALADRGKNVLLTTTDPAAHIAQTVGDNEGLLDASSIDPGAAVAKYRQRVMETKGAHLDADGKANLEEDLRSPCTEEVAVFQAFSEAVAQADERFVVMDTAPTGHTLLLMDATGSYHREMVRNEQQDDSLTPLERLQDPDKTSIIIVTLPETTPVLEAQELTNDLARANIEPWAWIVNRSLAATNTTSPLLKSRVISETGPIEQVEAQAERFALVPYVEVPPTGVASLRKLVATA